MPHCAGAEGGALTTSLAGVVHQHDLHQQVPRRPVDGAVDGPQQRAPRLVVEDDDDTGVGQVVRVDLGLAAENEAVKQNGLAECIRLVNGVNYKLQVGFLVMTLLLLLEGDTVAQWLGLNCSPI